MAFIMLIFAIIGGIAALPYDLVIMKTDHGPRYTYLRDDTGTPHLVDQWVKISDLEDMLRYDPDVSNEYHLFTRSNPSVSQPLVFGDDQRVLSSNYNSRRRSVILMHGFVGSAVSEVNTVLVPALPYDLVIMKTDHGPRYTYLRDDTGTPHLVDQWVKISDLEDMLRYDPDVSNEYHLFTRSNPSVSQPLVFGDDQRVLSSNYNSRRRSVILMHGFVGSAVSEVNTVLVPAYLAADDVNVIVIDWSAGSYWGPYATRAGQAAGRFVNWLNSVTGSVASQWTAVGFSVGGHGVGHLARTVQGTVSYVISLDPSERWDPNLVFSPNDGAYTEVIHTSNLGEQQPLAQVDFYPNGGRTNPGCWTPVCNHARAYFFLAESLLTGGFTGTRCNSVVQANSGACDQGDSLRLGGLDPKIGNTGIFFVPTNARQPFSQG